MLRSLVGSEMCIRDRVILILADRPSGRHIQQGCDSLVVIEGKGESAVGAQDSPIEDISLLVAYLGKFC